MAEWIDKRTQEYVREAPSVSPDEHIDTDIEDRLNNLEASIEWIKGWLEDFKREIWELKREQVDETTTDIYDASRPADNDLNENTESGLDAEDFAFGCSVEGNVVTITPGYWCTLAGNYTSSDWSVNLAGSTEYVYTWHNKDHSATGVNHSTTLPDSSGDLWICVLQKFTSTNAVKWSPSTIYHLGNVPLYGPTA